MRRARRRRESPSAPAAARWREESAPDTKRISASPAKMPLADARGKPGARLHWRDDRCELRLPLGRRGLHVTLFGHLGPARERFAGLWPDLQRTGARRRARRAARRAAREGPQPRLPGARSGFRGRRPAAGRVGRPAGAARVDRLSPGGAGPPRRPPGGARSAGRARPGGAADAWPACRSSSSSSVRSSSSFDSKRWMRSVRWRSSPGVCGPAQHQHRDHRKLGIAQPERLAEQVLVLDRAGGRPAGQGGPLSAREPVERGAHRGLVVIDHRIAIGRLVACEAKRVERERVLIGSGALLLHETGDHADLDGIRFHGAQA